MATNIPFVAEKMVPADVLRELTRGSYEHLTLRLESAVDESRVLFLGEDSRESLAVLATFRDHVVVGSTNGQYFRAHYEERDNGIRFSTPQQLDVPVVDSKNTDEYARQFALGAVDAILSGKKDEAKEKIAALVKLQESTEGDDLATVLTHMLQANRHWRGVYREQSEAIRAELADLFEAIVSKKLERKFVGLYDGSIAEDEFAEHSDEVHSELNLLADRMESIQMKAESAFYPFIEAAGKTEMEEEEAVAVETFSAFAEDYLDDMQALREHVAFALNNESCVMCLGQIHDALAEALTDYEIAGSFVERMASRYNEAA